MSAEVLRFPRSKAAASDWSEAELAEFRRVADSLRACGVDVRTEYGVSDEGDPWFLFLRGGSDDVIAHFARVDGEVVADTTVLETPVTDTALRPLLSRVLRQ